WTDAEVKGKILDKLLRRGKVEHSHTAIEFLQKGFPKDMVGRVKEIVQELVKENVLYVKPTSYGLQVSVNIDKSETMRMYVQAFHNADS
ncbi:MAG: hypothetical protein AABY01_02420, partial [Nanoarchaeota archaeon]